MPDDTQQVQDAAQTAARITAPQETVAIAPALFKRGALISIHVRSWTGQVALKPADQVIQGVRNPDEDFFKKGSVMLVPGKELKQFSNRANRFARWLEEISQDFPIPYTRFVSRDDLQMIDSRCKEVRKDFDTLRDEFSNKYPELRRLRLERFNEKHPEFAGRLDGYFPTVAQISGKFGFSWFVYEVRDIEAMTEIERQQQEEFRNHMRSYTCELAQQLREQAVKAALAFKTSLDRAKETVDNRAVQKFRNFLERFEHNNFVDDAKLNELIGRMKTQVFAIDQWNVEDTKSMDAVREHLKEIETLGADEGAAAAVARDFVREQTGVEVEFSLNAEQATGGAEFEREETPQVSPDAGSISAEELVGHGDMERNLG